MVRHGVARMISLLPPLRELRFTQSDRVSRATCGSTEAEFPTLTLMSSESNDPKGWVQSETGLPCTCWLHEYPSDSISGLTSSRQRQSLPAQRLAPYFVHYVHVLYIYLFSHGSHLLVSLCVLEPLEGRGPFLLVSASLCTGVWLLDPALLLPSTSSRPGPFPSTLQTSFSGQALLGCSTPRLFLWFFCHFVPKLTQCSHDP